MLTEQEINSTLLIHSFKSKKDGKIYLRIDGDYDFNYFFNHLEDYDIHEVLVNASGRICSYYEFQKERLNTIKNGN